MHSRSRSGGSQPQTKPSTYHEVRPRVWSRRKLCWRHISRSRRHKSPPADADSEGTPSPDTTHFSFPARPASRSRSRSRSRGRGAAPASEGPIPDSLQLLTWNIDALGGCTRERVGAVLKHIQHQVFGCADGGQPAPCCVLLQEVAKDALAALLAHAWVREHFVVAPSRPEHWPSGAPFGNVTLVARTVPVAGAWVLELGTSPMRRHAVVVDVRLGTGAAADGERTVRVVNVHLESLAQGAPYRPWQLRDTVEALARRDIDAGIIAGDMNAVTAQDAALPAWQGLTDAWKGAEDGGGNTWGYQPPSREFLPGRLDKVLYLPNGEFEVDVPERVGVGVKTPGGQWASDHFGLLTTIRMLA